jgi:hypothetical protein
VDLTARPAVDHLVAFVDNVEDLLTHRTNLRPGVG